jgi:hypothetical protein
MILKDIEIHTDQTDIKVIVGNGWFHLCDLFVRQLGDLKTPATKKVVIMLQKEGVDLFVKKERNKAFVLLDIIEYYKDFDHRAYEQGDIPEKIGTRSRSSVLINKDSTWPLKTNGYWLKTCLRRTRNSTPRCLLTLISIHSRYFWISEMRMTKLYAARKSSTGNQVGAGMIFQSSHFINGHQTWSFHSGGRRTIRTASEPKSDDATRRISTSLFSTLVVKV